MNKGKRERRTNAVAHNSTLLQVTSILLVLTLVFFSATFLSEKITQQKEQEVLNDLIKVEPPQINDEQENGEPSPTSSPPVSTSIGLSIFLNSLEHEHNSPIILNNPFEWSCGEVEISPTLAENLYDAKTNSTASIYQYPPGVSTEGLHQWGKGIKGCVRGLNPIVILEEKEGSLLTLRRGGKVGENSYQYSFAIGDSIVSLVHTDKQEVLQLKDHWFTLIKDKLEQSKCINTNVTREDFHRNPDYNEDYVGWERRRKLNEDFFEPGLSAGVYSPNMVISGESGIIGSNIEDIEVVEVSTLDVSIPEFPLFDSTPVELPEITSPQKPLPVVRQELGLKEIVVDEHGPGCGWDWSGVTAPTVSDEIIRENQEDLHTNQLNPYIAEVNKMISYNTELYNYEKSLIENTPRVIEYNSVLETWEEINNERHLWENSMEQYITELGEYNKLLEEREGALSDYETKVAQCEAITSQNNPESTPAPDSTAVEDTPTQPGETVSPPPPVSVTCPPVKPTVLEQELLDAPQIPELLLSPVPQSLQLKYSEYLPEPTTTESESRNE